MKKKDDDEMEAAVLKRKKKLDASYNKIVARNGKALEKLSKN